MAHHYQLPYIASFANPFADFTPSKRDALPGNSAKVQLILDTDPLWPGGYDPKGE